MKITLKPEVMTSKQIAILTGKRHGNVLRDIEAALEALKLDALKTECVRLVESKGRGAIKSIVFFMKRFDEKLVAQVMLEHA